MCLCPPTLHSLNCDAEIQMNDERKKYPVKLRKLKITSVFLARMKIVTDDL